MLVLLSSPLALLAVPPAQSPAATFELPRLKAKANPNDPPGLDKAKATVDELSPEGKPGAHAGTGQKVNYLILEGGKTWSRPLRGAPKETTFVSFFVYASERTTIDLGGAKLLIQAASKPGYAQMQVGKATPKGVQWRNCGGPVKIEPHGGVPLAALPVLTVRLDPTAGVWDLFVGNRLAAADLPLADLPQGATKQFRVHAGAQGAWICGLISADENPLYDDANANGIDDAFEQQQGGTLLAANAAAARTQLAQQWQRDQQARQVQAWPVQRPLPDGTPSAPPGKGQ